MADFNRHLKKSKVLVFFTIFAFLYMSCFTSCSKSKDKETAEAAKKSEEISKPTRTSGERQEIAESRSPETSKNQGEASEGPAEPRPSGESAGQKNPLTQGELDRKAENLDRYFQALEEMDRDIPRDTFDPQAIVDKVGGDPEALCKWVRDNTFLIPYRGSLRGPIGVLMDRLGNSLDRALLLYELLILAGHEVRLARGALSQEATAKMIGLLPSFPAHPELEQAKLSTQEMDQLIEKYVSKYKLNEQGIRQLLEKRRKEQAELESSLRGRAREQSLFIEKAVGIEKTSDDARAGTDKGQALQDHWCVQIKKDGSWIDLDPNVLNGQFGQALAEPRNIYSRPELEEPLFHRVKLRIFIEAYRQGKITESKVFEHTLKPSELIGKQILLRHIPLNWPTDTDPFQGQKGTDFLKTTVLSETEWLPMLFIDSDRVSQASFTTAGDINESPGKKKALSRSGGVTGGFLGGLAGEESEEKAGEDSYLTAEWVEYEILSPETQGRTFRRQVFDLVGPAAREKKAPAFRGVDQSKALDRGLALMGEIRILPLVCQLSPDFYIHLKSSRLLMNRPILLETTRRSEPLTMGQMNRYLEQLSIIPGPEYDWALLRRPSADWDLNPYFDRINLVSYFRGIRQQSASELMNFEGLDIIANEVSQSLALRDSPVQSSIRQGVIDTNAEALLMKENRVPTENAAEILSQSRANNIEWLTLRDPADQNFKKLGLTADDRARIEQELAAGFIVLVPNTPIQTRVGSLFAWWRIDPQSGSTLGISSEGKGQAIVERIVKVVHISLSIICWGTISDDFREAAWCIVSLWAGHSTFMGVKLLHELLAIAIDICGEIYKDRHRMTPWEY